MSRTRSQTAKATESEISSDKEDVTQTQAAVTPRKNTTAQKKTTRKKAPAKKKRLTLKDMQADLKSLETRLKRADTLTRKSVKTLEGVVESLDARTVKDSASQKSALSRRVSELSDRLETGLADTQAEIRSALGAALNNPNPEVVQMALNAATNRLQEQERQQSLAVAKINRHLANLAKAVEDRIIKDQVKASKALRAVEQKLSAKLETIENDSAEAIQTIGSKLSTLSEALEARQAREDEALAQKVAELTEQTQKELEVTTQSLTARVERLEQIDDQDQDDASPYSSLSDDIANLARQMAVLQSRLETMDANYEALQTQSEIMGQEILTTRTDIDALAAQKPASTTAPPIDQANLIPGPSNIVAFASQGAADMTFANQNPYLNAASGGQAAAISPTRAAQLTELPEESPEPAPHSDDADYLLTEALHDAPVEQEAQTEEAHKTGPIPYNPETTPPPLSAPQTNIPQALQQNAAMAFLPHSQDAVAPTNVTPPPPLMGGVNPATQSAHPAIGSVPINYADVESLPAGDPMIPYADPAYAEETMDAVRIGGTEKKRRKPRKTKKVKLPKAASGEKTPLITGRNMRVAAMATGLTLIGLFAAKSILFSNDDPLNGSLNAEQAYERSPENGTVPLNRGLPDEQGRAGGDTASLTDSAAPTIGVYEENQPIKINEGEVVTLQAAADKGDAIAQFQLGLAKLEQNDTDAGVTLIRSAAQTLPAAQYRLAKIYEAGQGVEKNTIMAKDLTERAARAGNRIAMHDLAIYYAYGNGGVDVDMGMAAGWFEKAAERGVVDSQFNLAILFENGQGVRPSQSDAYFWYMVASSQGDQAAKARLQALDAIMAPADIEAAKERADNFNPVKINQAANGIFKNLPWNKAQESRIASARTAQIKQAQQLLSNIGFEVGTPDGIMGRKTRAAITKFERSNGMAETGQITPALIDKLSVAAGA